MWSNWGKKKHYWTVCEKDQNSENSLQIILPPPYRIIPFLPTHCHFYFIRSSKSCMLREYCETAAQFGEAPIGAVQKPRHITVILNPAANRRLVNRNWLPCYFKVDESTSFSPIEGVIHSFWIGIQIKNYFRYYNLRLVSCKTQQIECWGNV